MRKIDLNKSFFQTLKGFKEFMPIMLGTILFISLFIVIIPESFYRKIFGLNEFINVMVGSIFGSVAVGSPITSYIIGGELLSQGVSLFVAIAFILAWVTVGIIQLPAESLMLGKKFAIVRNLLSFASAIIIAFLTVITLSIFI